MSEKEVVYPSNNLGISREVPIQIFIKPGVYNFYGKTYDLEKEGLYVFTDQYGSYNRILYRNNPWGVLSALAWLDTPSAKTDSGLGTDGLIQDIMIKNIDLSCGGISSFGDSLLQKVGIISRSVEGLNPFLEKAVGVTSGHNMLEIKIDKKWHLVDLDNNVYFQKNGKDLNFYDFVTVVNTDQSYEMVHLAMDENDKNDKEIKEYYKEVFKVGLISDGKNYFFTGDDVIAQKVNSYTKKYKWMDENSWKNKFYPN